MHSQFSLKLFHQPPFPLFPGEKLDKIAPLEFIERDHALRLKAPRDFVDVGGVQRVAGDEWLFEGPALVRFTLSSNLRVSHSFEFSTFRRRLKL